ncbi:hypothetical protein B0O99DRAFT_739243 [Bisporella sp. PMI_857]|nr:hypothetical protein B0O99DRAFT_739243 [Bisporella sp. PMI_857]
MSHRMVTDPNISSQLLLKDAIERYLQDVPNLLSKAPQMLPPGRITRVDISLGLGNEHDIVQQNLKVALDHTALGQCLPGVIKIHKAILTLEEEAPRNDLKVPASNSNQSPQNDATMIAMSERTQPEKMPYKISSDRRAELDVEPRCREELRAIIEPETSSKIHLEGPRRSRRLASARGIVKPEPETAKRSPTRSNKKSLRSKKPR